MACSVCKKNNCPCSTCHGKPKRTLGHLGQTSYATVNKSNGTVTCNSCGLQDQGFYDKDGKPYLKH